MLPDTDPSPHQETIRFSKMSNSSDLCSMFMQHQRKKEQKRREETAASLSGPISQNRPWPGQTPQSCYWWLTTVTTGGILGGQTATRIRPDRLLPAWSLNPTAALPHALELEWHPFSPKHRSLPLPLNSWAMKHQNNLNTKVPTCWNKVFWVAMLNAESLNHFMSQQDDKLDSELKPRPGLCSGLNWSNMFVLHEIIALCYPFRQRPRH